jgi:hypothetical protein
MQIYGDSSAAENILRVNKLMTMWPVDDAPPDGVDGLRTLSRKLEVGLQDVKRSSEQEAQ